MKKTILFLILALASICVSEARDWEKAFGAKFIYASKFDNLGIGIDYQWDVTKNIRINPEVDFFFKNHNFSNWQVNLNAHYATTLFSDIRLYPIAGISYSRWTYKIAEGSGSYVENFNRIGCNLGGGVEYNPNETVGFKLEICAQLIKNFTQCTIGLGVNYKF